MKLVAQGSCALNQSDHVRFAHTIAPEVSVAMSKYLMLDMGTLVLDAIAVGKGAFYGNVTSGGFTWRSKDGLVECFNSAFASGGLEDNGNGPGTLIEQLECEEIGFSTAFLNDEVI